MEQRSTWESIRTLFSPKTIPFLISQGVGIKLLPVGTMLLGIILAFVWAYLLFPVVFTNGSAVNLELTRKQEYVKAIGWQLEATGNTPQAQATAKAQLDDLGDAGDIVTDMINHNTDDTMAGILQTLKPLATNNPAQLSKIQAGLFNGNLMPFLCIIGTAILVGGAVVVNTIIPITLLFQRRSKERSTVTEGAEAQRRKLQDAAIAAAKTAPPPADSPVVVDRGTPVKQYVSTYVLGDDLYDDSFSIETPSNEFLGEMGAGISKTIGVGDPKKVTATEVWVFDKNDIRTMTKVLMSENAYNDEGIRAELAAKGEAVLIQPGSIVLLETQTLTVQARVLAMTYGSGALPPNSFFEQLSVEISAWPKVASTSAPTSAPEIFGDTSAMR